MDEKKYLTAKEARERMLSSFAMKNHCYKSIAEASDDGRSETYWDVEGCCEEVIQRLINDLEGNGYTVLHDTVDDPDTLIIKW